MVRNVPYILTPRTAELLAAAKEALAFMKRTRDRAGPSEKRLELAIDAFDGHQLDERNLEEGGVLDELRRHPGNH